MNKKYGRHDSNSGKRRVLIVDDHLAVCDLIGELIESLTQYLLVGKVSDGIAAIEMAKELKPDVIILDVMMPGISGVEVLRRLQVDLPSVKVLVFSARHDPHIIRLLMQAGICGFVTKNSPLSELRNALIAIANGNTWFNEDFGLTLRQALLNPPHPGEMALNSLTPRERELAILIAQSRSSKQAANLLGLSSRTIENHRARLMQKLGVRDVAGIVRFAVRVGLVDPEHE